LPVENNYFDLHTVSDVVMQVNYTAREGGQSLRAIAANIAQKYLPGNGHKLFDVKNEMADAWFSLTQPAPTGGSLPMQFGRGMFPFLPYQHQMKINCVEIFVEIDSCEGCDQIVLAMHSNNDCHDCDCDAQVILVKDAAWGGMYHGVLSTNWILSKGNRDFGKLVFPTGFEGISRVYLLSCFDVEREGCKTEASCECSC